MAIKLLATDLDGTFLRSDKTFDLVAFQQLADQLKRQQIHFVAATGNQFSRVNHLLSDIKAMMPLDYVADNGAYIQADQQLIQQRAIDPKFFEPLLAIVDQLSVYPDRYIDFTTAEGSFIPNNLSAESKAILKTYHPHSIEIDSPSEIDQPVLKFTLSWSNASDAEFAAAVKQQFGDQLHVTSSGYGTTDLVAGGVNKASGLAILGEHLGIAPDEMATFGDGSNDIEMLNYVGHPFVMPNAPQHMHDLGLPLADDTNEQSGVIKTMERLVQTND